MASRRKQNGCVSCGGPCDADAVDNHGQAYKGCPRCRILSMDEIKARQRGAKIPHVPEDPEAARRFARAFNTIDVAKVARAVDALAAVDAELTELREARADRDRLRALLAAYGRAVEEEGKQWSGSDEAAYLKAAAAADTAMEAIQAEAAKWREWG